MIVTQCAVPGCRGHFREYAAIIHGQQAILTALSALRNEQETTMASIEDGLTEVETAEQAEQASLATLGTDEQRELADLAALKAAGGTLTPEEQARFDALTAAVEANKTALDADDAAINTADPAPAS